MKKYIFMAAVALLPLISVAQHQGHDHTHSHGNQPSSVSIMGHVLDAQSGDMIPYATVIVDGTTTGTLSDIDGNYHLDYLPEGEVILEVSIMGYKSVKVTADIKKGETTILDIPLNAESLSLDQVVVTSSRNAEKKTESASIVSVVSPRLFTATASASPVEALNFGSGVRTEYACGNCGTSQLRINGMDGAYSQVLLDSRPMFSSLASVYGLEQLPTSMIERIEVIRGGGSALYGANAIGGVVNIITKEPARNSFSVGNTTMVMGGSATDVNSTINGSYVSEDSKTGIYIFGNIRDRQAYDRNGDGFSEIPVLNSSMAGFRAYQKVAERGRITAEYHHIDEYRRGGDNVDLPPHEAEVAEQLEHKIDGGSVTYDYLSRDYKDRVSVYTAAQNINRDSYFGTDYNLDAYGQSYNITATVGALWAHTFDKLWFMPATFTAGFEYNYDKLEDAMVGYDHYTYQTINQGGAYFQNEWKNDKFTALIGGRIDKHCLVDNVIFSPRINFRYAPIKEVAFRASYSAGYRAPQVYDEDLHIAAVGGEISLITQSEDLKTEYSHSISGSVDLYKTFGNVQMNLLLEGFYTDLDDVFILEDIGTDAYGNMLLERRNGSGATVMGLNTELRMAVGNKFNLQMGFTAQNSEYEEPLEWSEDPDAETVTSMLRTPDTYGYITATYPFAKRFNASLSGTYTGSMLAPHYEGYVENDTLVETQSFFDMGARLSYYFGLSRHLNLEMAVGAKNIFDSYQKDLDVGINKDAGYIYGPNLPRSFYFSLRFYL